jgi:hypothetical protein
VEVQANSNYRLFMDEVLPYATELRKRYAACNCTSALSVVLRCACARSHTQAVTLLAGYPAQS